MTRARMQVAEHVCGRPLSCRNSDIHQSVVDTQTGISWEGFSLQQAKYVAEFMEKYYSERGLN